MLLPCTYSLVYLSVFNPNLSIYVRTCVFIAFKYKGREGDRERERERESTDDREKHQSVSSPKCPDRD